MSARPDPTALLFVQAALQHAPESPAVRADYYDLASHLLTHGNVTEASLLASRAAAAVREASQAERLLRETVIETLGTIKTD